jgi:hypothetical protein
MNVPIINVNNSSLVEESIYAKRLRDYYSGSYYQSLGLNQDSIWNGRKRLNGYAQMRTSHITIQEEEYKGHQIAVVGFHREFRHYLDPVTYENVSDYYQLHNSILESDITEDASYIAFGYKIGHSAEPVVNITHSYQFAIIKGTFGTNSFEATMKKAKKRLDLHAKIDAVRDELIALAPERWVQGSTRREEFIPYNVVVGDKVFVQAHGRLRKGIVVDTTGSRFIVGYVTPANHNELKYKTLPLSLLYKQEKV